LTELNNLNCFVLTAAAAMLVVGTARHCIAASREKY